MNGCSDCQQLTGGDCGKHGPQYFGLHYTFGAGQTPHRCPICDGKGKVQRGFYDHIGVESYAVSDAMPECCRSCNGIGVLWR